MIIIIIIIVVVPIIIIYIIISQNIVISSETEVSAAHWTIPTQYFWPRVFGAPIIYVIPVTKLT